MTNAWKVLWKEKGQTLSKTFEGDKPSETDAPAFIKHLKARGISDVYIVSKRRAYAPPVGQKAPIGLLWCPFCVKFREFAVYAVSRDGIVGPEVYRCTVCTISTEHYWVRKYNAGRLRQQEMELEIRASVKRSVRGNNISSVRKS